MYFDSFTKPRTSTKSCLHTTVIYSVHPESKKKNLMHEPRNKKFKSIFASMKSQMGRNVFMQKVRKKLLRYINPISKQKYDYHT